MSARRPTEMLKVCPIAAKLAVETHAPCVGRRELARRCRGRWMSFVSQLVGSFYNAPMVRDVHRDRVRAWCISMAVSTDDGMERRFWELLGERIGRHFRRREQEESFALVAHGIVADGERKSVEPIVARATGGYPAARSVTENAA